MYTRLEDLLTIRDGEPIDAGTRARLLADPHCAAEIERLRSVQRALQDLPELAPPPGAWAAIAARTAPPPMRPGPSLWKLLGGAAIAASVAVTALALLSLRPDLGDAGSPPPAAIVGVDPAERGPLVPAVVQTTPASYEQESARLERLLARLPQRAVVNGGTALTIAELEDRIAFIDQQLMLGAARGLPPEQRVAFWRERVDLMNALVHVRYAQAEDAF